MNKYPHRFNGQRWQLYTKPKLLITASVWSPSSSLSKSLNINDIFLAPDRGNPVSSPYSLTHKDTGRQSSKIYTNIGLATTKITINPDNDMVNMYPGKSFTTQVRIGLDIFSTGEIRASTIADPCLYASPLSCLKAGETYEVDYLLRIVVDQRLCVEL
ncbi:uncharacterized protein EAF01_006223 [Botrytis porri]|uniref:Uncharacterized protein n=1 Tax=Botrytis porri TaxID=87229 RepID=A0A4Z1K806_9HELO|nr:uncharacterized protein EAF01_006223 [Botrytis porri]KAF7903174.1 hypothetical protein EAF01_006223 [Botrytis porri]TGO81614.1 hypothetical protein BPOR_1082g00030 [Botrytis porri]